MTQIDTVAAGIEEVESVTAPAPAGRHEAAAKRKVLNRLRRAQGQLGAVIDAVESDSHCRDVVHQLSAVSKALDRAGFLIISTALQDCLDDPDAEDGPSRDELEKLFMSLA